MDAMIKVQVLRAACCVAGAAGRTEPAERRIVDVLAKEVGVGEASIEAMIQRAETEENYVNDQFRVLKADPKETMVLLFTVALADGSLEENEIAVLRRLSERLDVTPEDFEKFLSEAKTIEEKKL